MWGHIGIENHVCPIQFPPLAGCLVESVDGLHEVLKCQPRDNNMEPWTAKTGKKQHDSCHVVPERTAYNVIYVSTIQNNTKSWTWHNCANTRHYWVSPRIDLCTKRTEEYTSSSEDQPVEPKSVSWGTYSAKKDRTKINSLLYANDDLEWQDSWHLPLK